MNDDSLDLLISGWLDKSLSEDSQAKLQARLAQDPAACERFWQLASMHGLICEAAMQRWGVLDLLLQEEAFPRANPARDVSRSRISPIADGNSNASGWMESVPWRLVGMCVFCLALIMVVMLDLRPRFNNEQVVKSLPAQPVEHYSASALEGMATLVSDVNCRWKNRLMPLVEGASIASEQLELVSGTAELLFGNGAHVILEGPACLMVQDAGRALLTHGKLAAQVPKRAVGFTITTPTVEVVDFGTEFGVAVSKEGTVDVAVLVGKIEVGNVQEPIGTGPFVAQEKRVVTAGEAVSVHGAADRLVIETANFNTVTTKSLAKPFKSMARMLAKTVAYQVSDGMAGNQSDFHGGVGLDFEVRARIRIFSLGVFDHLGDGIDAAGSPLVQLWTRDTKNTPLDPRDDVGSKVLASQMFSAHDSGELKLGHRFKPLPKPIDLPPGSYSIVAYDFGGANPFIAYDPMAHRVPEPDGRWAFDESLANSAGSNDGDYSGESPEYASGRAGNAIDLNGKSQVTLPFDLNLDSYTITAWVKPTNTNYVSIISAGVADPIALSHQLRINSNGKFEHYTVEGFAPRLVTGATRAQPNTWYHVAATATNGGLAHLYVDGVEEGAPVSVNHLWTEGDRLKMGVDTAGGKSFRGLVDDVRIYKHVLNLPQIQALYREHTPLDAFDDSRQSVSLVQIETWNGLIVATGSRLGESRPGIFPTSQPDKHINYVAGSFEYVPRQQEVIGENDR